MNAGQFYARNSHQRRFYCSEIGHWFFGVQWACVGVQGVHGRAKYAGMGVRGRARACMGAVPGVHGRAYGHCMGVHGRAY